MQDWNFQEWYLEWTLWGLGWITRNGSGWKFDELTVSIGPLRFVWLR